MFRLVCFAVGIVWTVGVFAQTRVEDIFGRVLNERGLTLVDCEGYMANPLIKFFVVPPADAVFPGSATLKANGARLYFESPGNVSPSGPTKIISFANAASRVPVQISIFPDRDGVDEDYSLTIVFTGADARRQTNSIGIHVVDQDTARTNDFNVLVNFDRDVTGFFTNAARRDIVKQAAQDWAYFFGGMDLDVVPVGAESTYIWNDNFNGGYSFVNTNSYRGYQLYGYGTQNDAHRSGGEASYSGGAQRSNGVALTIKRSGGFEAEIHGNYNTLGWLLLTNDDDWLVTGNLGNETNDLYSIAHHEIGHALIFNPAHPGFSAAKSAGGFHSAAVTNYFGRAIPIDSFDHLNGIIDPESGQGVFGYEYYGNIPRKRWLITKLDLLCAQEVGYALRQTSAFAPLSMPGGAIAGATATLPFHSKLNATGGIPFYDFTVVDGNLPSGVGLDRFTGELSGKPAASGTFSFGVRVREYRENDGGITNAFTMQVAEAPAFRLELSSSGIRDEDRAQVSLFGTDGQQQVVRASSDLVEWISVTTNLTGTSLFEFIETNAHQHAMRFYDAVVLK
jgi:hypothetical protein